MKARILPAAALFALAGCNIPNGLVGGHCSAGYSESDGTCERNDVPLSSSPSTNGFAGGAAAMSSDEPSFIPQGGSSSSSRSPAASSSGAASESRPDGGSSAQVDAAAPLHCDGSLVACRGDCISVTSDGNNCGACGKICPSNMCVDGECQGALAGDVIVLGHDYATAASTSAQAKMIANALSIATTDPIRVLAFDGAKTNAAAERALIAEALRFRDVAYSDATSEDLEATDLAKKFDVVLVHDAGQAASYLGARTRGSLETFTKQGGIVVALDDGTSDLPAFLSNSGLLSTGGHYSFPHGTQVVIAAPNDALGMQVFSPYAPSGATLGFLGVQPASDVTIVAHTNDVSAYPTAIHRFVR